MDLLQLRDYIIQPSTKSVNLWSPSSDVLLLGTCGIETNYGQYMHQIGGPALGVFQMEPATHDDIWENYLNDRQLGIVAASNIKPDSFSIPSSELLIYNLYYATLMARVHYLRVSEPLPTATDAIGMATYYKKYYNTHMGATDISKAIAVFKDVIAKLGG